MQVSTCISSRIEKLARTLVVLDVDGEKKWLNVKNTHRSCKPLTKAAQDPDDLRQIDR